MSVTVVLQVGSEFVRLYYKVMNSYSAYLNLFYEQDSTVTVCESQDGGKPISMQAATQEVRFRSVYELF